MFYVPIVELRHTTVTTSRNWEQDEPDLKPRCPLSGNMVVESDNWGVWDFLRQLQKVFQKIFLLIHYILKWKKNKWVIYFLQNPLFLVQLCCANSTMWLWDWSHGGCAQKQSSISIHDVYLLTSQGKLLKGWHCDLRPVFLKHEVVAYKCLPHEQDVSTCTGAYELKRSEPVLFWYRIHLSIHKYNDRHPSLYHSHSLSSCPLYLYTSCSTIFRESLPT